MISASLVLYFVFGEGVRPSLGLAPTVRRYPGRALPGMTTLRPSLPTIGDLVLGDCGGAIPTGDVKRRASTARGDGDGSVSCCPPLVANSRRFDSDAPREVDRALAGGTTAAAPATCSGVVSDNGAVNDSKPCVSRRGNASVDAVSARAVDAATPVPATLSDAIVEAAAVAVAGTAAVVVAVAAVAAPLVKGSAATPSL